MCFVELVELRTILFLSNKEMKHEALRMISGGGSKVGFCFIRNLGAALTNSTFASRTERKDSGITVSDLYALKSVFRIQPLSLIGRTSSQKKHGF